MVSRVDRGPADLLPGKRHASRARQALPYGRIHKEEKFRREVRTPRTVARPSVGFLDSAAARIATLRDFSARAENTRADEAT